jgi:hypothetical protein
MLSDYTFLTDHSYSLRPVVDDNDELSLKKREEKTKKSRRSSNRTLKTTSTTNRKASIDRSSSDKENNSSSSNTVTNKTPSTGSRRARLSTRIAMTNTGKKQDNKTSSKTSVKSTSGSIIKKKKVINRGKAKLSQLDSSDVLPSLSIEERVKLRRTKPLQPSPTIVEKKSQRQSKSNKSRKSSPVKTTKSFLGSGLDLDNIVLGNRQRRCVQT